MAEKVITTKRDDLILELNRLVGVELKNTPKKVLTHMLGTQIDFKIFQKWLF